ncbi:MAG: hypothetical protein ABFR82_18070 [Nitrospirota bacterium]
MKNKNTTEYIVLISIFASVLSVPILNSVNPEFLINVYCPEDGPIENLTVFALLCGAVVCLKRLLKLKSNKQPLFLLVTLFFFLMFLFGAGEEVSWGQRIFNIESPEFFKKFNEQGETNIHNLAFGGIEVNIVVFSKMLGIILCAYIFILPYLYRKKQQVKEIVDSFGIPLPMPYQGISIIVLFILTDHIFPSTCELLELGGSFLLVLMVAYPYNREIFQP